MRGPKSFLSALIEVGHFWTEPLMKPWEAEDIIAEQTFFSEIGGKYSQRRPSHISLAEFPIILDK